MNVVQWLSDYLASRVNERVTQKLKVHSQSSKEYFNQFAKIENRIIQTTNFASALESVFPKESLVLTKSQKAEINDFLETHCKSYEDYAMFLREIAKILSDFEETDQLKSPIAISINANYDHLKSRLQEKYPSIYQNFQEQRQQALERLQVKTVERPTCKFCGSNELNSYGTRWLCKQCLRTFNKKIIV